MNPKSKQEFKNELQRAGTLADILKTLEKYYDTENCEAGIMVKVAVINGLEKLVNLTRCKPRKKYL